MEIADYRRVMFQGLGTLILAVIVMLFAKNVYPENVEWQIGRAGLFLFAVINPISGMFKKEWKNYFMWSVLFMAGLTIDMAIVTTLISKESFRDIIINSQVFILPILIFISALIICRIIGMIFFRPQ